MVVDLISGRCLGLDSRLDDRLLFSRYLSRRSPFVFMALMLAFGLFYGLQVDDSIFSWLLALTFLLA